MNLLQSMIIAFSMYSKLPMPHITWHEKNMKYAMCFFPMVGIVIGLCEYVLGSWILRHDFGNFFFSACMTLLPILLTGGIHLDGFMDTTDALASYGDREKKLAILKDSHVGAFAVLGLCVYLIWSLAMWSEVHPEMLPVVAAGAVLSRALSGFSVVTFPAARKDGLGKTFQDGSQRKKTRIVMCAYVAVTAIWMLIWHPVSGAAVIVCAAGAFGYYAWMSKRQFGGMTGDLAGYFLQVCELAMLTGVVLVG